MNAVADPRVREIETTIPVYGQLPFVPVRAAGCDIVTDDGRRILDLYGGHAVAALGYSHPRLSEAIQRQSRELLFQSNASCTGHPRSGGRGADVDRAGKSESRVLRQLGSRGQ